MKTSILLLCVSLVWLTAACERLNRSDERTVGASANAEAKRIMEEIGLYFPPDAKIIHADYMDGPDDAARLAVSLPEAEWLAMVKKPPFDKAVFAPENNFTLGSDHGGWTPGKELSLSVAQLPWAKGRQALNIGASDAKAGIVTVYLFWNQL